MTRIINLYGGPGTGKSTSAAYLYYRAKSEGVNVELVREYVKDWAWEGRTIGAYDQIYFMGKQVRRESLLYGKVELIVTDSPVLLGVYYAELAGRHIGRGVRHATEAFYDQAQHDGHRHHHVLLERSKPYNQAGRYQTDEEARIIDGGIRGVLDQVLGAGGYAECSTDRTALDFLYTDVMDRP